MIMNYITKKTVRRFGRLAVRHGANLCFGIGTEILTYVISKKVIDKISENERKTIEGFVSNEEELR